MKSFGILALLTAGLFFAIPASAAPVNLVCTDQIGGQTQSLILVVDEAAGTAGFAAHDGYESHIVPAVFTQWEITWDVDLYGFAHPFYILNRATGQLRIIHHKTKGPDTEQTPMSCSVAKPIV